MKRVKRHKIKQETPETSTSRSREQEEHDLAYYIHDRVELMHQVFSVIKPKELKAMAPECVYHITVDDLQELCTEELLGISSKRLCAILDGADPPTDTESSSSEHNLETISLDSISSDDEVLSQHSSKKRHKHKKHKSRSKHRRRSSKSDKGEQETDEAQDRSKASRAGLTVLELLELQARARAIRAQLQQDNANAPPAEPQQSGVKPKNETSEDEVEIKEEPAEVVEISSEDEKPNIDDLPVKPPTSSKDIQPQGNSKTVTKRVNDLIITVPQTKSRKIVLNRTKSVATTSSTASVDASSTEVSKTNENSNINDTSKTKPVDASKAIATGSKNIIYKTAAQDKNKPSEVSKSVNNKSKQKKKQKKKDKKSDKEEDHDEITLQLSDTEKMDLLEDLDRKNYENFTSSSEDSESSSESDSEHDISHDSAIIRKGNDKISSKNQDSEASKVVDVTITTNQDTVIDKETEKNNGMNVAAEVNEQNTESSSTELEKSLEDTDESDKTANDTSVAVNSENNVLTEVNENSIEGKSTESTNKCLVPSANVNLNLEADINKSPNISSNNIITEHESNKSLDMVLKTCEDTETNIINENNKESHQAIKSVIVQLRNEETILNIIPQTMTPVTVICGNTEEQGYKNKDCNKNKSNNVVEITTLFKNDVNTNDFNTTETNDSIESIEEGEITNTDKDLSEGEIADHEEKTETNNPQINSSDVVCVSDDDEEKRKKKKKKDKKLKKKDKKSKKSKSDFREGADQNFFSEDNQNGENIEQHEEEIKNNSIVIDIQEENNRQADEIVSLDDDDDIYEILDISDDSSCYEVEGITVSKEPTAEEIAALSAKIDEIHTDDVIVLTEKDDHFNNDEVSQNNENIGEPIENISWRDRYLGSTKVKRVLTTSNILNALRKKNKELKRKLEESKEKIQEATEGDKLVLEEISDFVEGSIEHFNTLQGSSKFVDPVVPEGSGKDAEEKNKDGKESEVGIKEVTKEMEKDAKQLLKMYKRLLKYNDVNKKKDPNKKKKKKQKKSKEKDKSNEK